ncbi:RNase P subunit p30 [Ophiocordyceps camponoti-floridani]|uniref:RNase P subunit p30 n=1 Tax=Ophiocordyceps camponoti-floridani TaxID=2030778 RepID=A0A8H4Q7Y6_9HYPO|nr:RNase P subunit p30 [Ophiocordyceps camponoti-floridani]
MLYDLNLAWSPATPPDRLAQTLSLAHTFGYAAVALNHILDLPLPAKPSPSPFPPLADSDSDTPDYRLPALAAVYDIIAVRPLTEKALQNACLSLEIPLISLDLTAHFPFHFRPKTCMAAVARGVRFELCYAQMLVADTRGRANFIGNLTSLVRATRGRGFVVSSEAKTALALRAPADVVNLLSVWGLSNERGLEGLRGIPRSVVVNEAIKRRGFRGVVDVVQVASPHPEAAAEKVSPPRDAVTSQKRKGADSGPDSAAQPLSKRQAKKMKLAARAAAAEKVQAGAS